jgi:hypothetical protein
MPLAEAIIKVNQSERYRELSGTSTGKNSTRRTKQTLRKETKIARRED